MCAAQLVAWLAVDGLSDKGADADPPTIGTREVRATGGMNPVESSGFETPGPLKTRS